MTTHTRVCSRHFKPSDYLPSLTLIPTAVPSVFHWKKRSPLKRKAPTRRSPIKRKKATEKATTKADLPTCDSTCEVFLEPQETAFLSSITENLENTTVDQPADDSKSIIRDIKIENERLRKEIHQVTTSEAVGVRTDKANFEPSPIGLIFSVKVNHYIQCTNIAFIRSNSIFSFFSRRFSK